MTMTPIFVGGCERSGTTLLATLLAGHSRVVAPPEAQFFLGGLAACRTTEGDDMAAFTAFVREDWRFQLWELPPSLPAELARSAGPAEVMAGLASAYAQRFGESSVDRWVDHMPMNIAYTPTLLREFDSAPMIHIVRDPRAVIASALPLDWGPPSPRSGARWWLSRIAMGLAAEAAYPERVVRVYYEDLVRDPNGTLMRLCPRVGLAFEPTMVEAMHARLPAYTQKQHALVGKPPDPARIDAWRAKFSERDIAVIEGELREVALMLGYERSVSVPTIPDGSSPLEFLRSTLQTARQRWRHRARVRRALERVTQTEHSSQP